MANIQKPKPEDVAQWNEWVEQRPFIVRETIQRLGLAPWKLYRLKTMPGECSRFVSLSRTSEVK